MRSNVHSTQSAGRGRLRSCVGLAALGLVLGCAQTGNVVAGPAHAAPAHAAPAHAAPPASAVPGDSGGQPAAPQAQAPTLDPQAACANWRWIGVQEDSASSCPPPRLANWTSRDLFSPDLTDKTTTGRLQRTLAPFCVYESRGAVDDVSARDIVDLGQFESFDRDCLGLSSSAAPTVAGQMWKDLRERFSDQVGEVDLPKPERARVRQPVRLALLDTAATRQESGRDHPADHPGNSPHGYTLANLARDLVDENVRITTRLALPWVRFDANDPSRSVRDEVNGGHAGLLSDLATAILGEVADWQRDDPERRLVINLSLGWDPDLYGGVLTGDAKRGEAAKEPASVRAVRTALEIAAAHGAVIVAASGNLLGLPSDDQDALLPAAWERLTAPSTARCEQLLGAGATVCQRLEDERTSSRETRAYRPLLHAAGGLHGHGGTIANARPGSLPRLMAYAAGAVTVDGGGRPTTTLVGSSVAALIVSSTVAAVWSLDPKLSGHRAVQWTYESGRGLGEAAELHLGATAPERNRIELCAALRAACSRGLCEPPVCRERPRRLPPPEVTLAEHLSHAGPMATPVLPVPAECGANYKLFHNGSGPPMWMCPFAQLPGVAHHTVVGPQPQSTPCPNCSLIPDPTGNRLLIEVDPSFGASVSQPVLHINGISLALPVATLGPGECAEVTDLPTPNNGEAVSITFMVGHDDGAAHSPVMVLP